MKTILLLFILTTQAFGFTLISSPPVFFPNNEITINVSSNTCANVGITTTELLDLAENAMDRFWNSAPTSAINIKRGAVVSVGLAGNEDYDAVLVASTVQTILVACSSHADLTNLGGIGGITSNGTDVKGALIINNQGGSPLASYSDAQLETLVAHEVGHAIGIHHSGDPAALMYYSPEGVQEVLAEDDIDAVTYLYPHESKLGCMGALGTTSNNTTPPSGPNGSWILSLMLGLMLVHIFRPKIRTAKCRNL